MRALRHLPKQFVLGAVLATVLFAQQPQGPLTDERIAALVSAGVRMDEVLRIIAAAPEIAFDLSPAATNSLLSAGVSEQIIRAMAARESGAPIPITRVAPTVSGLNAREGTSVPVTSETTSKASPAPVAPVRRRTISSLNQVRRVYIEKLPNDFDQYLRAEFFKQMPKYVTVVLDKAEADAIITGVDEHDRRIASTITGRYLGLHDNTTASISVLDSSETAVLWSNEAGDRSLTFPIMHRDGERKVASRIVGKLKKAMKG